MMIYNYWTIVNDYASTFYSFGIDWVREEIVDDMIICRNSGERLLRSMDDEEFDKFARDVADYYFNHYYMKEG